MESAAPRAPRKVAPRALSGPACRRSPRPPSARTGPPFSSAMAKAAPNPVTASASSGTMVFRMGCPPLLQCQGVRGGAAHLGVPGLERAHQRVDRRLGPDLGEGIDRGFTHLLV